MAQSLVCREATPSEAGAIAAHVNRCYRGEEAKKSWTHEAELIGGQRIDTAGVALLMRPPQSAILIAEARDRGGEIFGSVHVQKHASGDGYFGMLAVDPSLQNTGAGAFLISKAEEWARRTHAARAMRLSVITVRRELIAYYERKGFAATGEVEDFPYGQPEQGDPFVEGLKLATYRKSI